MRVYWACPSPGPARVQAGLLSSGPPLGSVTQIITRNDRSQGTLFFLSGNFCTD